MRRIAFALAALALVPAFAPAPFPSRRARVSPLLDSLQGRWALETLERSDNGRLVPSTSSTTAIRIEGNRWIMLSNDGEDGVLDFALGPTCRPARIDFRIAADGVLRPYSVGIVKVEGDALTLVWIQDGADSRPADFGDVPSGGFRAVFRKQR